MFDWNMYETAFRSYDPQIGRFHQIDPLSTKFMSWSTYSYSYNNPVFWNDPSGASPYYDENESSFNGWIYDQYAKAGMFDAYYQQQFWQYGLDQRQYQNYCQNMALLQQLWDATPAGTSATYTNTPGSNGQITGYFYSNQSNSGTFVTGHFRGSETYSVGETYYFDGFKANMDFANFGKDMISTPGSIQKNEFSDLDKWSLGMGAFDIGWGAKEEIINYASKFDNSINELNYVKGIKVISKGLYVVQVGVAGYNVVDAWANSDRNWKTNDGNKWGVTGKAALDATIGAIGVNHNNA